MKNVRPANGESGLLICDCVCKKDCGRPHAVGYLAFFDGHGVFSPQGKVEVTRDQADAHNKALSRAEIDGLKKCKIGQCGTFYWSPGAGVTTFIGERVADYRLSPNGSNIEFSYCGMKFRGRTRRDFNAFNFKRVS